MKKKSTENSKQTTTQQKKNLGGRPKGSKNSLTILQEAAINGVMTKVLKNFDRIVKTTIKRAEDGDRLDRWLKENPTPALMIFNNIMKLWGVGEREQNYFKDGRIKKLVNDQLSPVILSKGDELAQVMFGNKEFYDFVLRNIPKPIANPSFFISYAVANFFNARTSDDLTGSNKRAREINRNRPDRPDRPKRQRAR